MFKNKESKLKVVNCTEGNPSLIKDYLKKLKLNINDISKYDLEKKISKNFIFCHNNKYFYYIILDIEILEKDNIFLIGVFIPDINLQYNIIVTSKNSINYLNYVKDNINDLFSYLKINTFKNYNLIQECIIYPVLVGHNIIDYDLVIIINELVSKKYKTNTLINNIIELNNSIINNSHLEFKQKFSYLKKEVYNYIYNIFIIDTLKCVSESDNSLFYFKIKLFLEKNNLIPPLEFNFNNKINKKYDMLIKYNYNDLYYTWKVFIYYANIKIKARMDLFENFILLNNIFNFKKSVLLPDSMINTAYIIEQAGILRKSNKYKHDNLQVFFYECKFLFKYFYYEKYFSLYSNINLSNFNVELQPIKIKNTYVKPSVGGLHSTTPIIRKKDKLNYIGSPFIFSESNRVEEILLIDLQSFYVNLCILLTNKFDLNKESNLLLNLNNKRL